MAHAGKKVKNSTIVLPVNMIVNSLCICMFVALILFMAPSAFAQGDVIKFRHDAPHQHVVVKGDTLWDISAAFLSDPWLWPQVWRANPAIINPHLIYPGDVITLVYQDGQPRLMLSRASNKPLIALSPQGVKRVKRALGLVNWQRVASFVSNDQVLSQKELMVGLKVIGNPQQLTRLSTQQLLFASQTVGGMSQKSDFFRQNRSKEQFSVVHKTHTIYDMQGDVLGEHVKHVAALKLQLMSRDKSSEGIFKHTDAVVFKITDSKQEVTLGDSIVLKPPLQNHSDVKMSVASLQSGFVVAGVSPRTRWSQDDVVVIDIGQEATQPGMVFGIYAPETTFAHAGESYVQPRIKLGHLVVITVFAKTSFGVIVSANSTIQRGAQIMAP